MFECNERGSAVAGSFFTGQSSKNNEEVSLIRKADLENHNKDGGFWTVIDGKVYDIKDFQAQSQSLAGNSILGKSRGIKSSFKQGLKRVIQHCHDLTLTSYMCFFFPGCSPVCHGGSCGCIGRGAAV